MAAIALIVAGSASAEASLLRGPSGEVQRPRVLVAIDARTGKRLWRADMGDRLGLAEVQYGMRGLVYTEEVACDGRRDGAAFVAYDAATGSMRWRVEVSPLAVAPGPYSIGIGYAQTFGVGPSAVVVTSPDDTIRGLDPRTGKQRWAVPNEGFGGVGGTAELVILRNASGALRAVDRRTGVTRWTAPLTRGLMAGDAAVSQEVVAFSAYNQYASVVHVYVYDTRTGVKPWQQSRTDPGSIPFSVSVVDKAVVVAGANGVITAYDATTGSERWKSDVRAKFVHAASPAGPLLGIDGAEQFVAVDPRDGSSMWAYPGFPGGTAASTSSLVLQGTQEGLAALDAHTGHRRWVTHFPRGGNSVAIVGRRIVFGGGCDVLDP